MAFMESPNQEQDGFAALRRISEEMRQMTERLRLLGPREETEDRKELRRKYRRARLISKLTSLAVVVVVLFAGYYFLLRYGSAVRRWLEAVPSWLWTGLLLLLFFLSGPFLFLFFIWRAIRTKDPDQRGQWVWAAVIWGLLLLAIVLFPPRHIEPF
jgi:hypothetical protein